MALGENFPAVLAAAQIGMDWAFERLFDELHPRLTRYLEARAPGEGEDLAADVWLAVAGRIGYFEGGESQFRSWFFTIAHHRLVDHLSRTPRALVPLSDIPEPAVDGPEPAVTETDAAMWAVRRIAGVLGPDHAEVVLLRILGGLDVEQVAAIVGKRAGTVRVIQHRALRKLAKEISLQGVTE